MEIACAVVAHTGRIGMASELALQVGAPLWVDDGRYGPGGNHARAWGYLAHSGAAYGVVLEDDALPVPNMLDALSAGLEHLPTADAVVSLYLGTSYPVQAQRKVSAAIKRADDECASWIKGSGLLHGVGVVLRTDHIASMLSFRSSLPYDEALGLWAKRSQLSTFYCHPSLVDHADEVTVVDHPDGLGRVLPRRAHRVGVPVWSNRFVTL